MFTLLAITLALATEPIPAEPEEPVPAEPEEPQNALLVSPIGPAVAMAVNLAKFDEFGVPVWAFDLNLRGHHLFDDRWGLTVQLDLTMGELLLRATHVGLRVGPRMALRKRGLADWTMSPFVLVGATWLGSGGYPLARWGTLGLGAEMGRTFEWRRLAIELGWGLYVTRNVGYHAQAEALVGSEAPSSPVAVLPIFTWSVGHAF